MVQADKPHVKICGADIILLPCEITKAEIQTHTQCYAFSTYRFATVTMVMQARPIFTL